MAEVFMQVFNFMKTTQFDFEFNGSQFSFTFFEICITLMVIEIGIFIISKLME